MKKPSEYPQTDPAVDYENNIHAGNTRRTIPAGGKTIFHDTFNAVLGGLCANQRVVSADGVNPEYLVNKAKDIAYEAMELLEELEIERNEDELPKATTPVDAGK
ncbi:MAG: hypothetical protein ACTSSK_03560 [Candidatus Heimdallarchaeota archaeon]